MNIPYVFKKCSKCGCWLVANSVNFSKKKGGKYGLGSYCKACKKVYNKEYREQNKDKIKKHRKANKDKMKEYRKQNKEKLSAYQKEYRDQNRDKLASYHKEYHKQNRDKKINKANEWKKQNLKHFKEYHKKWGEQYRKTPKGQVVAFNSHNKRRAKEQAQGDGITTEQWLECMNYFNWKCAYSGKTLTKDTRSLDHIVPLNNNGEHEIWNLVPMVKSLNSSKQDKDMLSWYQEQEFYSEERLTKIREWREYAYKKYSENS